MITRLLNRVQLSVYSTLVLFHKYFVGMKNRGICKYIVLSESLPLKILQRV